MLPCALEGALLKLETTAFVPARGEIERTLRGATVGDAVLLAQQYLRGGIPLGAAAVCDVARGLGLADPALTLSDATARFAAGDRTEAARLVDELLGELPDHLGALHLKALFEAACGRRAHACELLLRVVDGYPDFPGAQGALSALMLPGPRYRDVLQALHRRLRPRAYLEIGVETGATLALAAAAEVAVGVDPDPESLAVKLPPNARTVALTSDDFFARETRESVFGSRRVDLAFIDGMHWFEQALRDFAGVEQWAEPSATVVLHDCLPVTRVAGSRERRSTFWVGDTWKALECLLDYRPDLRIRVVPTPPSGLVMIRGLDPSSNVIADRMDEMCARYRDIEYPHTPGEWPARFGVVTNDESGLGEALGP